MRRVTLVCLLVASIASLGAVGTAREITTFLEGQDTTHAMALGSDGAVWICVGYPPRVFRLHEEWAEEVPFEGRTELPKSHGADFYVDPSGKMLIIQHSAPDGYQCPRYFYDFDPDTGLSASELSLPGVNWFEGLQFDLNGDPFAVVRADEYGQEVSRLVELTSSGPRTRYTSYNGQINSALVVSSEKAWVGIKGSGVVLFDMKVNQYEASLDDSTGVSMDGSYPLALDTDGRLWLLSDGKIVTSSKTTQAVFDGSDDYRHLTLAVGNRVWAATDDHVVLFQDAMSTIFGAPQGLLDQKICQILLSNGGSLWVRHESGVSCIRDGGNASQRVSLNEACDPDKVIVQVTVENCGFPVWADLFMAYESGGKMLFWPDWTPHLDPLAIDLNRGFQGCGTMIEAYSYMLPAGTYTLHAAITARGTYSFLGGVHTLYVEVR